jgi:hypothetical protein
MNHFFLPPGFDPPFDSDFVSDFVSDFASGLASGLASLLVSVFASLLPPSASAAEQPAQLFLPAFRALRQGFIVKRLPLLEGMLAGIALVVVRRHRGRKLRRFSLIIVA